jgi:hypothetical protein
LGGAGSSARGTHQEADHNGLADGWRMKLFDDDDDDEDDDDDDEDDGSYYYYQYHYTYY